MIKFFGFLFFSCVIRKYYVRRPSSKVVVDETLMKGNFPSFWC